MTEEVAGNSLNDEDEATTDSEKLLQYLTKSARSKWIYLVFLLLLLMVLVGGVYGLAKTKAKIESMTMGKEIPSASDFLEKIDNTQADVKIQYEQYTDMIADGSALALNQSFKGLYELSLEAEKDYVEFVRHYNQLLFDVASRVKGSGEWYFYQEKTMKRLLDNANKQQKKMIDYFGQINENLKMNKLN